MNIPKVRFHGFKEKWREESLSKLFVERHEISTITESLPQLSFTISEGVIYPDDRKSNKRDFLIKDILSKKYLVTCVGDILYNPANVIYGAIHRNSLCDGVVSPIYKIFKTEQDSNFMECVVRNPSFISQLSMKTEGTVTKLKTLKPESFLEMIVKIAPSIYEQRKIASYFQTLDSLIQTTSKKLASLKQIKAASLQSMFPQEGETVPKVRFKGFEGEWNLKYVFELLCERNELSPQSSEFPLMAFIANNGIAEKGERYDRSALVNDVINKQYKRTYYGDFIYSSNNLGTGSIGLNTYGKATISPVYSIFYCTLNSDSNFVGYCMTRKSFIKEMIKWRQGVMYGQWRIHENDFLRIKVLVPSLPEQQQIGTYFRNLDQQISLQTQRLEKLKQIKSACLDKMFV